MGDALRYYAQPISRFREAAGSWDANTGKYVPGAESPDTIQARIQPTLSKGRPGGQSREELEEGVRIEGKLTMWSLDEIKDDDIIIYPPDGKRYRVFRVEIWADHWQARLEQAEP